MKITISKLGTLRRRRQGDSSRVCAEPHRKIGERSLEILESAIDREDLLVDCAPLRDGGGIEGADGRPSACVEIVGGVAVEKSFPHGRVRFRPAGLWPRRRPSGSSVGGESGADASRGFVLESTSRGGVRHCATPTPVTRTLNLRPARRNEPSSRR